MRRLKNSSSKMNNLIRRAKLFMLSSVVASSAILGSGLGVFADKLQDGLLIDTIGGDGESTLISSDKLSEVDENGMGTIEVVLKQSEDNKNSKKVDVSGIEFSLLKVADIEMGEYVLLDDYVVDVDLNNIKNAAELESAAIKIANIADYGETKKTDANGRIEYDDLEVGVYLLEATDVKSNEKYDEVTPLLVAIPTFDEEKGQMSYDITVNPKHSPRETPKDEGKKSPSTDAQTYAPYFFGGAAVLAVLLIVTNVALKTKKKADK